MADTLRLIEDKESEFSSLFGRMDKDRDLAYLAKYTLQDSKGKDIPNVVSVTMNDAAVFANTVVSALIGAVMQTVVEGLSDKQNGVIERFLDNNYAQADERLSLGRISSLMAFWCNHIAIRGFIGARWLSQLVGEKYVPDCLPIDMRYCVYEIGANGYNWVAPKFTRSKGAIEKEYGIVIRDNEAEVTDFWDDDVNEIWIDKKLVRSQKNPLGKPPFVIQAAATGFMLQDKGYLEHEGESIFMLDRDLYPELNRIASIEQTLNMKVLLPPYQKPVETPGGPPPPYPDKPGQVTEVLANQEYRLLEQSDLKAASRMAHADIMSAIQRGSLSNVDYGNLTFPLSAVAIGDITEIRDKVLIPRLQALAIARLQLSRLLIDQYIKGGISADIGTTGKKQNYSATQLGDPTKYTITYKFMSKSRRQEIANLSMAIAAKGTLSRDTIIRDIMQAQNPDQEIAKLEAEEAEQLDPSIKLYSRALSLIDKADQLSGDEADALYLQARALVNRACELVKERKMAMMAQPQTNPQVPELEKGNVQPMLPLLSPGGAGRATQPEEVAVGE